MDAGSDSLIVNIFEIVFLMDASSDSLISNGLEINFSQTPPDYAMSLRVRGSQIMPFP